MISMDCKIRVRYSEVGRQGLAHHANYLNWFDIALEELIKKCGMSYKEIEELGYFFAPLSDRCTYYHPAMYGDDLTIRVSVADASAVKIRFYYESCARRMRSSSRWDRRSMCLSIEILNRIRSKRSFRTYMRC
jgi:acyl-CoA thioester hydrolase